jgi:hypothetical protein
MATLYRKEKLFIQGNTSELTFAAFFKLVEDFIQSETLHSSPKYIHDQIVLYSKKEKDAIVLFTMHPTSDDDHSGINKSFSDILKESDYEYYTTIAHTTIDRHPAIQLDGKNRSPEDNSQETTKTRKYKIVLGVSSLEIIGFQRTVQGP